MIASFTIFLLFNYIQPHSSALKGATVPTLAKNFHDAQALFLSFVFTFCKDELNLGRD